MRRERIIQIKRGGVPVDTPAAHPEDAEQPPVSTVRLIRPVPQPSAPPDDLVAPGVPLPRTGTDA